MGLLENRSRCKREKPKFRRLGIPNAPNLGRWSRGWRPAGPTKRGGGGDVGNSKNLKEGEKMDRDEEGVFEVAIRNKKRFEDAREHLLRALEGIKLPKIQKSHVDKKTGKTITQRDKIIGTIGRTTQFGFGMVRFRGWRQLAANEKYPEVLKALVELGNIAVPKGFKYNIIQLNEDVKAKKHLDRVNVGPSVIVGIGPYTGGNLRVFSPDDKTSKSLDVHNQPIMFNGAIHPHQTEPFKGKRWTIIFYKQKEDGKIKGYKTVGTGHPAEDEEDLEGGVFA